MARFGALGGEFGLGGMSFPTRTGRPESGVVNFLPSADDWLADWQARYDAEEAKRRAPRMVSRDVELHPNNPNYDPNNWQKAGLESNPYSVQQSTSPWTGEVNSFGGKTYSLGEDLMSQRHLTGDSDASHTVSAEVMTGGYTPDFSLLNAEKERMVPKFEQQTRLQQSYDKMQGGGLLNAIVSPEYAQPGFGQINGEFGQSQMGANAPQHQNAGLDTGWMDGVYTPGAGDTAGVYGSKGAHRRPWGP